jgi:Xaa-Pro aminopeptidase
MNYKKRLETLKEQLQSEKDVLFITNLSNIRYLCGFSGSTGELLVSRQGAFFFTDFRYVEQAKNEVTTEVETVIMARGQSKQVYSKIKELEADRVLVENSLALGKYLELCENFERVAPAPGLIEEIRKAKEPAEEELLKKAFDIADSAFARLMGCIKPGMTELEVAAELEYYMKLAGSAQPSFDTIIASGPNAACPHHQPTTRVIQSGEMVKIDFGATYAGYHSDMTRTVFMGKSTDRFKEIYNLVLEAQKTAIAKAKVGIKCSDVDAAAREVITKAGYGEYFGHGLGHSLGLNVHESPSLSPTCDEPIKENQIFTFEPGIYLPDWGGVRIEDVYMVKQDGLVRYTNTPNLLLEINN